MECTGIFASGQARRLRAFRGCENDPRETGTRRRLALPAGSDMRMNMSVYESLRKELVLTMAPVPVFLLIVGFAFAEVYMVAVRVMFPAVVVDDLVVVP